MLSMKEDIHLKVQPGSVDHFHLIPKCHHEYSRLQNMISIALIVLILCCTLQNKTLVLLEFKISLLRFGNLGKKGSTGNVIFAGNFTRIQTHTRKEVLLL